MPSPRPSSPAGHWTDLANALRTLRVSLVEVHRDVYSAAADGVVSSPRARPLIAGRSNDTTARAAQALAELEQTLRNEAARLERRGPR